MDVLGEVIHLRRKLVVLDNLCCTLQESGVEIEDIARVRLASGRATQEEADLTVRDGLLGEVVIDDERVPARVAEILADGSTGERREVLHGRGVGRCGGYDNRVCHCAVLLKGRDNLRHG